MTERHPLSDALNAAEHSAEAQGYEVPVELIRSRSRRRRRARTGGAAGALALVVATAALVVPNLPSPTPAPATDDLPALRHCGQSYAEFAADDALGPVPTDDQASGGFNLTINPSSSPPDARWSMDTRVELSRSPGAVSIDVLGSTLWTTVVLLRDSTVVAVLDDHVNPVPTRTAFGMLSQPDSFPVVEDLTGRMISCTTGESSVAPGDYELVATTTLSVMPDPESMAELGMDDLSTIIRTTSKPVPVEVEGSTPVDPQPAPSLPAVCGLSSDDLAADDGLKHTKGQDDTPLDWWFADVRISSVEREASGEGTWRVPVTTHVDAPAVDFLWAPTGVSLGATVVLLRDGAVVAVLDNNDSAMPLDLASTTPIEGAATELPLVQDLRAAFVSCATGEQVVLDPGQYDLLATTTVAWRVIDPAKGDQTTYTAVARTTSTPITVTVPVRAPVVEQTPSSTARPSVACGETINPFGWRSGSTWLGKIQLSIADGSATDPQARVANNRKEPISVSRTQVLATRGGTVIGYIVSDLWDVSVEAGSVYFSPPISSLGEITWCPGVTPPEEYATSLAVDVVDGSGTTSYLATALAREPVAPAAEVQCGDDLAPRDYPARAARITDVRFTTRLDGDGWQTLVATNTGALPVSISVQGHAGLLLEPGGRLVGSSLLTLDARPPEVLAPGASIDVVTISPGKFGSCGDRHVEIAAGPASAWALVRTDLGELVSGPYAIDMPAGDR